MTPDNGLVVIGGISVVMMIYRTNLVLAQEFSDDDDLVKDPLACAVSSNIDFKAFKKDNWKGFQALWAAIRFRTFYKRFTPLISPQYAMICAIGMLFLFIGLLVVAQIGQADPKANSHINDYISGGTLFVNSLWCIIIEHGRILKNSVKKLKTTL